MGGLVTDGAGFIGARFVQATMDSGPVDLRRKPRQSPATRYSLDDTQIRGRLGYVSCIALDRGPADTVAWYQDNPHRWTVVRHRRDNGGTV
jgi:dTDP-D-glucose 4,6-dehydratase